MSLRSNTIANYIGQGYSSIVGIIILPLYLRYLGAEAYGLVGFFAVLQALLTMLDMGLSPSLGRQVAFSRGASDSAGNRWGSLIQLLRSMEIIFLIIGSGVIVSIWFSRNWLSKRWLNVEQLPLEEVAFSIAIMGFILALRLFGSLYRSGIQGMERQVRLNVANITITTLRFFGAYALLRWVSQDITHFFSYQLAVSIIETIYYRLDFYYCLPKKTGIQRLGFSWKTLKPVLPFAIGVTYASVTWILITQIDKLILSKTLPLKEYGYYALVAVITNGLMIVSGPISQAVLPRMTYLLSQGNEQQMLALYRKATQYVGIAVFSIVGVVSINPTLLLYAWTGNREAAEWAGPVLTWFALGSGIISISAFQYYLQYAHGKLKLHMLNSTLNAFVQIPIILYLAFFHSVIAVAIGWFSIRLVSFFVFPAIVHRKFAKGLHLHWLFEDIFPILIATGTSTFIFRHLLPTATGRLETIGFLFVFWVLIFLANIAFSGEARRAIWVLPVFRKTQPLER